MSEVKHETLVMDAKLSMSEFKLKDVIAAVGGELVQGDIGGTAIGISTDSRTIKPGELFVALIGENSDGHDYAADTLERGAAGIIVSHQTRKAGGVIIRVPNTLDALGDLAAWHRRKFNVKAVAITGSVGKTSTKEMIAAVLAHKHNVLKSTGNFNNEVGVPLTVFQLEPEHEILVQELAMRLPGEIAELAVIVKPDIGVITNIGISHIERLGSQDAIAEAKSELVRALPRDGIAILNVDDPYFNYLTERSACEIVSYGVSSGDIRAEDIEMDSGGHPSFKIVVGGGTSREVSLPLVGGHNVANALAAAATGLCFGMSLDDIAEVLHGLPPTERRANVFMTAGGYKIFDDSYNASPASMMGALRTLASISGTRKIAVLGDMKELGDHTALAHAEVGRVLAECGVSLLVTVGELGAQIAAGARESGFHGEIREYSTSEGAAAVLKAEVHAGDVVLVKGSRAMKMENVVEALR